MRGSWKLNEPNLFGPNVSLGEHVIHVLVKTPEGAASPALLNNVTRQEIVWDGTRGSILSEEGIDPTDSRTLSRISHVADIIRRLEKRHVLLVKSPPMTGKTSLATLVSQALVNRHTEANKKKIFVFSFSAYENENFEASIKRQCGMEWKDAVTTLPMQGCNVVYLVLDETQTIYQDEKATYFWYLVKSVLGNAACNVRVLMFAVYSPGVVYARDGISIGFDASFVLGIDKLNFSHAEVYEDVTKWFKSIACFAQSPSTMEAFCTNLEALTGEVCHENRVPDSILTTRCKVIQGLLPGTPTREQKCPKCWMC